MKHRYVVADVSGLGTRGLLVIENGPATITVDVSKIIDDLEAKTGDHAGANAERLRLGLTLAKGA